jgi:hypothetical protein
VETSQFAHTTPTISRLVYSIERSAVVGSTGSGGEAVEPVVQDSGFSAGERVRVTGKGGIQGRARVASGRSELPGAS